MARARSPFHVDSTRSEISIRARPGFAESVFFYVHAVFTMVIGAIALAPLLMRTPGAPLAPNLPLIVFGVAFYFVFVAILGLSLYGGVRITGSPLRRRGRHFMLRACGACHHWWSLLSPSRAAVDSHKAN